MGLRESKLGYIVWFMALLGGASAFGFQYWINVIDYPLVISGKPLNSWPAFFPVTFEITILFSAFGTVLGMLALNGLPQLYHALFSAAPFSRVTSDGFCLSIEAKDPLYAGEETAQWLVALGASSAELVEDAP